MDELYELARRLDRSRWLTEKELARRWNTSRRTLQRRRKGGSGPDYIFVGRSVRYPIGSVEQHEIWMLIDRK